MAKKKNNKIIKYHRSLNVNIGLIVFIFIFIYLIFNIYSYLTSKHVSYVEVEEGALMVSTSYHALALREEQMVYAPETGQIDYYLKENSKAAANSLICSIDENGSVSKKIEETASASSTLDDETFDTLIAGIRTFASGYSDTAYYDSYVFRNDLRAGLMEAANLSALASMAEYAGNAEADATFHRIYTKTSGVISYYEDAYENVTVENFTAGMFDESEYSKKNLKLKEKVEAGESIYKIVSSESWYLVLQIDDMLAQYMEAQPVIQIRFKKDNTTAWAYTEVQEKSGQKFLVLSLNNSMIRFLSDRFVDIDLQMTNSEGLKIANSSITTKDFFSVPKRYFTYGGDSSTLGLIYVVQNEDGTTSDQFVATDIYGRNIPNGADEDAYSDEEVLYYVKEPVLEKGTLIKDPVNPSSTYTLGTTVTMQGVYNVNKGYTIFRKIEILYQNEEYSIIAKGTGFGIAMYDHIVLDASLVEEGEVI